MQLVKNLLMMQDFVFIKTPQQIGIQNRFAIDLESYPGHDLERLHKYKYYEHDISPDYDASIKIALDEYLKKQLTDKDLDKIELLKAEEIQKLEAQKEAKKPKFEWVKKPITKEK